jgi:ribosomal protein S12 methylthiotransferase accessory factor
MVYRQSHIEDKIRNEIKSVLPWGEYVKQTSPTKKTPFGANEFILETKRNIKLRFVSVIEKLSGKTVYIEDDKAVLYQLPPETRSLLSWLVAEGLLATWNFGRPLPTVTLVKTIYLFPEPVKTPGGGVYSPSGANGIGTGTSFANAALSALGEFIERNASSAYWWENKDLYQSKFLKNSRQINPALFSKLDAGQYPSQEKLNVDNQLLHWVPAVDFATGKIIEVPASLVYMYFKHEYENEPFFEEVSSNGAATYSDYEEACTRAILELVERDVFVRFWYHKEEARKIRLSTLIPVFPELQELLNSLSSTETVEVYELQNTLEIPTFIATLTNEDRSKTAFNITAASDLCADKALQKVVKEIIRFAEEQYPVRKDQHIPVDFNSEKELQDFANSLSNRRRLWAYQEMLTHTSWISNSPEVPYQSISQGVSEDFSTAQRYQWLQAKCKKNSVRIFLANTTNSVAKYAGLHVVRALSPDLLSIFFKEELQPLGSKLFTHDSIGKSVTLNPIPHPFI